MSQLGIEMNTTQTETAHERAENKTLSSIAASIGGSACGVAVIFCIFGHDSGWPAAFAIASLALMGVGMAYFDSKRT
jgi:hypothetical protein